MPKQVTALRVFLAGPGDVRPELRAVDRIVADVNLGIGIEKGVRLEVVSWQTHVAPGMGRPQQVILDQIQPEDIFVGVLWKRAGTATGLYDSGTIEEFELAFRLWRRSGGEVGGRPRVLLYFCDRSYTINDSGELRQVSRLLRFRASVSKRGLVCAYTSRRQFEDLVRRHLTSCVRQWRAVTPKRLRQTSELPASGPSEWRGPVALMVADIEGFERLNIELGSTRCDGICDTYQRIGRQIIQKRKGTLVSGTGDHLWAVFHTSSDALRSAVDLLRHLQAPELGINPRELPVRIALHWLDLKGRSPSHQLYRDARIATALAGLTVGGHVVATGPYVTQYTDVERTPLDESIRLHWHKHGAVEIAGFEEEVELYEVIDVEAGVRAAPLRGQIGKKKASISLTS